VTVVFTTKDMPTRDNSTRYSSANAFPCTVIVELANPLVGTNRSMARRGRNVNWLPNTALRDAKLPDPDEHWVYIRKE